MKTVLYALLLAGMAFAACHSGNNGKGPDYAAKRDSMLQQARNPRVERMPEYNYNSPLQWPAADMYIIQRQAIDSLGMVRDDEGTMHCNNCVKLILTRRGEAFFKHTFTKADFASMGSSQFFGRSILTGMAFDGIRPEGVRFMASVGLPDSDEYVQFAITIGPSGDYMIEPTEVIDETLVEEDGGNIYE